MLPSAPFRDREFNGATLLEEWAELRSAGETPVSVASALVALRPLARGRLAEVKVRLSQWTSTARPGTPALCSLVARWLPRVRTEPDAEALLGHLERLALVGELLDGSGRRA